MKAAILGAGAMGSIVGAHLKRGGAEVYFIDVYEEHMKAVAEKGITMELESEKEPITVFVDGADVNGDKVGVCDVVIVLVKCYDTEKAVEMNRSLFGKDTVAISLQNGVGGPDLLLKHFDADHVGMGVLQASANLIAPGRIFGSPRFGYSPHGVYFSPAKLDNPPYIKVYEELAERLTAGGMPAECNDKTEEFIWNKLVTNVMFNGIAALLQLANEDTSGHEDGVALMRELARETCEVAKARGLDMDTERYQGMVGRRSINRDEVKNFHYVSMCLDSYHKRKTEIDFINGAIVKEGQKHGIPTPYNETICRLVRIMQDTYYYKYEPREV